MVFYFPTSGFSYSKIYKMTRPASKSTTFFMKIVDSEEVLFFFVTMSLYQSIFLSFALFLTCEGTSLLHIKPLDDPLEEQLEDGLALFLN